MARSAEARAPVREKGMMRAQPPLHTQAIAEETAADSLTSTGYSAKGGEPRGVKEEVGDAHAVHYSHLTLPRTPVAAPLPTPATSAHSHSADESHESGLSTVPSTPSLDPVQLPAADVAQPNKRLLDAGLAAMKKNLWPGLALQCVALLLILVYYGSSSAQDAFDKLAEFKADTGYLFSAVSTMIFGALLPMLIVWIKKEYEKRRVAQVLLLATGLDISTVAPDAHSTLEQHQVVITGTDPLEPLQLDVLSAAKEHTAITVADGTVATDGAVTMGANRGPTFRATVLFLAIFWFIKGVEVDAFFRLQSMIWGTDSQFTTILGKVMVEQFVYNFYAIPLCLTVYFWKDSNFSFTRTWAHVYRRHFWLWLVPECLMSAWMVWLPACSMVYLMPDALQVPLFNVVLCFWSLVLVLITGK